MAKQHGVLLRWNEDRGFGFVMANDGTREQFFLHAKGITSGPALLARGMRVLFDIAPPLIPGKFRMAVAAQVSLADGSR